MNAYTVQKNTADVRKVTEIRANLIQEQNGIMTTRVRANQVSKSIGFHQRLLKSYYVAKRLNKCMIMSAEFMMVLMIEFLTLGNVVNSYCLDKVAD